MFGKKHTDVMIVGAGPIGMMTALILAKSGIDTTIVDKASRPCTRSNALLLHPTVLKSLDRFGLAERVLENSYRIDAIHLYDDTQIRESIHLNQLPVAFPRISAISQNSLERVLEDELARLDTHVRWDHRAIGFTQDASHIEVNVDRLSERFMGYAVAHSEMMVEKTLNYHAKLMVAADGYNSLMRNLMQLENKSMGEPEYFAVFEFETDADPQHALRLSIHQDLLTAQIPQVGGRARLAFQYGDLTLPPDYREKDRLPLEQRDDEEHVLDDEHLVQLIDQRVPWNAGFINRVTWRAAVPFEKRAVPVTRVGRAFLLGDAARSFGPLASTGMNLGILEAERLALAIKDRIQSPDLLSDLDRLAEDFRSEWNLHYQIENHVSPAEMADPWIANHRSRILQNLPASGETLEKLAGQIFLHVNLPKSVLARAT